jgi:hypothetical protein
MLCKSSQNNIALSLLFRTREAYDREYETTDQTHLRKLATTPSI